jgi:hypothetical protein
MLNKGIKEDKGAKRPLGFLFLSPTFCFMDDPILEDYDFIIIFKSFFFGLLFIISSIMNSIIIFSLAF